VNVFLQVSSVIVNTREAEIKFVLFRPDLGIKMFKKEMYNSVESLSSSTGFGVSVEISLEPSGSFIMICRSFKIG
jgi:hypothetical protein